MLASDTAKSPRLTLPRPGIATKASDQRSSRDDGPEPAVVHDEGALHQALGQVVAHDAVADFEGLPVVLVREQGTDPSREPLGGRPRAVGLVSLDHPAPPVSVHVPPVRRHQLLQNRVQLSNHQLRPMRSARSARAFSWRRSQSARVPCRVTDGMPQSNRMV